MSASSSIPAASPATSSSSTIFVSIISYRDPETRHTLESLFVRARHPERIYVGIVWQYQPKEDSSILFDGIDLNRYPSNHVRQLFLPHSDARGPCYARYLCQTHLYGEGRWCHPSSSVGEDFYLQLDSHMRMVDGWDEEMLNEWDRCRDSNAILTAYPTGYERGTNETPSNANDAPPLLCASHFDANDGMLRFVGRLLLPTSSSSPSSPLPCLFYAAGFAFGPGRMVSSCPYDPHLCNLFFGEELSMLVRLWTNGFNMFQPTKNLVWHCWSRAYRPSFREITTGVQVQAHREAIARKRVQALLGMPPLAASASSSVDPDQSILASLPFDHRLLQPESPYGLGPVRTLLEFEQHVGIDFSSRTISERAKNGGLESTRFKPPPTQAQTKQIDLVMQLLAKRNL